MNPLRIEGGKRALPSPADYVGESAYLSQLEGVFPRTWHFVLDLGGGDERTRAVSFELLPGSLAEPLILVRGDHIAALSNACTHRGNLLLQGKCTATSIRCRYHGRSFDLSGRVLGAPGFDGTEGFPSPDDDLPRAAAATWGPLAFAALAPELDFAKWTAPLEALSLGWKAEELRSFPEDSRGFDFDAHWALYVENYLEGLHIPYVHPGLSRSLEMSRYEVEVFAQGVLQTGYARDDPDQVAAYYLWLFPATMFNIYPWGLSLNAVQPLGPRRTRVLFRSFVSRPELRGAGAGADLDQVELEDETVVQNVQRGIHARLYRPGRYAKGWEDGVRRFHELLLGR